MEEYFCSSELLYTVHAMTPGMLTPHILASQVMMHDDVPAAFRVRVETYAVNIGPCLAN
jgi:hypothetical protein